MNSKNGKYYGWNGSDEVYVLVNDLLNTLKSDDDLQNQLDEIVKAFQTADGKYGTMVMKEIKDEIANNFNLIDFLLDTTTLTPHEPTDGKISDVFKFETGIARLKSEGQTDGKTTGSKRTVKISAEISQYHDTITLTPEDIKKVRRKIATMSHNSFSFLSYINTILPTAKDLVNYHLRAHLFHMLFGDRITEKLASEGIKKSSIEMKDITEVKPIFKAGSKVVTKFDDNVTEIEVSRDCGIIAQATQKDGSIFDFNHPLTNATMGGVDIVPYAHTANVIEDLVDKIKEITETNVILLASTKFYNLTRRRDTADTRKQTLGEMLGEFISVRKCPQLDLIKDFDGFLLVADSKLIRVDMSAQPLFEIDGTVQGLHGKQTKTTNSSVSSAIVYPNAVVCVNSIFSNSPDFKGTKTTISPKSIDAKTSVEAIKGLQDQVSDLQQQIQMKNAKSDGQNEAVTQLANLIAGMMQGSKVNDVAKATK